MSLPKKRALVRPLKVVRVEPLDELWFQAETLRWVVEGLAGLSQHSQLKREDFTVAGLLADEIAKRLREDDV
jgi:hypothetical protein